MNTSDFRSNDLVSIQVYYFQHYFDIEPRQDQALGVAQASQLWRLAQTLNSQWIAFP